MRCRELARGVAAGGSWRGGNANVGWRAVDGSEVRWCDEGDGEGDGEVRVDRVTGGDDGDSEEGDCDGGCFKVLSLSRGGSTGE